MEKSSRCILLGVLFVSCVCEAQRYPLYHYPRAQRPQQYQPPPQRPLPRDPYYFDDYYDDGWTSASGFHSSRPPREPYYYDDYDYDYGTRPTPQRPNSNGRPPRPNSIGRPPPQNSMSMDDMYKEAQKYSGKTRSLAQMFDQMQGTYEDKILPTLGDGSAPGGFDLQGVSGLLNNGADMMDGASSLFQKLTTTFGSK